MLRLGAVMIVACVLEYVLNGLEMRATTVSQAITVVTTSGDLNGFHLDSTLSAIRGRAAEKKKQRYVQILQHKAGVCSLMNPSMPTKRARE